MSRPPQAIACRLLPGAHWALLYVIAVAFVLSFIMFESGGSFSNEGRHTLWTMLCALMVFVLTVRAQGFPARPAVHAAGVPASIFEPRNGLVTRWSSYWLYKDTPMLKHIREL